MLENSPSDVGLVYAWMDRVEDSSGLVTSGTRKVLSENVFEDMLSLGIPGLTPTLLIRSSVAQEVGGFDESLSREEDPDFIFRVSQRCRIKLLPEVVAMVHAEHGHERLSENSWAALTHRTNYIRTHMVRFRRELAERPKAMSSVLRELSAAEMMLGRRLAAMKASATSFRFDTVSRDVIAHIRLIIKLFIWYATPLSHFRSRARVMRDKLRRGVVNHGR